MAICTAAFPSIVGRSQAETTEDTESIEITVKKKCLEQGFTEDALCPFVSKKIFKKIVYH